MGVGGGGVQYNASRTELLVTSLLRVSSHVQHVHPGMSTVNDRKVHILAC